MNKSWCASTTVLVMLLASLHGPSLAADAGAVTVFTQHAAYTEQLGAADARALARQGTLALLSSGLARGDEYAVRYKEYQKFGIQWTVTGDADGAGLDAYRSAFNEVMFQAIEKQLGGKFLERTERRIERNLRDNNRGR